jgi:hypothetical protein
MFPRHIPKALQLSSVLAVSALFVLPSGAPFEWLAVSPVIMYRFALEDKWVGTTIGASDKIQELMERRL